MKKRLISVLVLVVMILSVCLYTNKSEAATSFYYPTTAEIDAAINSIKSEYPAGSKFTGKFDGGVECIGFAKYAFNRIWGVNCTDAYTATERYKFSLSETSVVTEVGSLTGSAVTYDNVRNLFKNTPKGSIVQLCTPSGQHSMLFVSCDDYNIYVLEANIDYNLTVGHSTISYSYFVNNCKGTCTISGKTSPTGVSTYKYNGKKNSAATIQNLSTYCYIKSNIDGKYLTATGTDVVMKSQNYSYDQVWKVERITDKSSVDYGSMKITSLSTGKSLTMANSSSNGADVYLSSYTGSKTQKWYGNYMLPSDYNTYMISSQATRKVLDVTGGSSAENTPVQMWEDNRGKAQQFKISSVSGSDIINPTNASLGNSFIATIKDNSDTQYLTNRTSYTDFEDYIGSTSQLWKFTKLTDGSYQIQSVLDKKYLAPSAVNDAAGIALSTKSFNWNIMSDSGYFWDSNGKSVYISGYKMIYPNKMLVMSGKTGSKAVLNTPVNEAQNILKISNENIEALKFYSGNDWIGIGETVDMSTKIYTSPSTKYQKKFVTWSVSDSSIATVDSTGKITGKKVGTVTLTVTSKYNSDIKATKTINVGTKLTSISLNETDILMNVAEKKQLTVTYNPTNTTADKTVTWSSSDTKVATVDSNGNVTAVASGTATITAKVGTLSEECIVKVKGENSSNIEMEVYPYPSYKELSAGDSLYIYLKINTASSNIYKGNMRINFDSNIFEVTKVATKYMYSDLFYEPSVTINQTASYVEFIYNGKDDNEHIVINEAEEDIFYIYVKVKDNVTKFGDTSVTLTTSGITQTGEKQASVNCIPCSFKIVPQTQSLKLKETSVTMFTGYKTMTLTPIITPSTASTNLQWSSSDTSIATVSSTGVVRTKNVTGTVTITAKTKDGTNLQASCIINVKRGVSSVSLTPYTYNFYKKGEKYQIEASVTPTDADNTKLQWASSDTKVATVDQNGLVTAVGNGSCKITATSTDGTDRSDYVYIYVRYPESIEFTEKTSETIEGNTKQLVVLTTPSNIATPEFGFTCSDTSIIELYDHSYNSIRYKAKKAGTVTITAKCKDYPNLTATHTVTVKKLEIPLQGIHLNNSVLKLNVGETSTLEATYYPSNTTETRDVTWSTSNSSVATVSNGKITAKGAGTATITATVGNITATCKLTVVVPTVALNSISLNKTTLSLTTGGTSTLTVTYNPTNTTESKTVTWTTSNSSVATVSNGKITAKGAGTATITAKVGNKTATCKVTVTNPTIALNSISLNKTTLSLTTGGTSTLTVTYNPTNTTDSKTVTWTTSNSSVATVSNGKITAKGAGTATITAKVGSKTATCKVTVTKSTTVTTPTTPSTPTTPTTPSEPEEKQVGVSYYSHVQDIGWEKEYNYKNGATSGVAGKGLKVEAIKLKLENAPANAKIVYQAHVQDIGWEGWKTTGQQSGTTGKNKKVEAIRIKLQNMSEYSVMYRAYVEGLGWQPWVCDGIESGSTGKNLKLEAIQVKIIKSAEAVKTEPKVQYYSHIQDIGWEQRYSKSNGVTSGVEGKRLKVEAICLQLTGVQENAQIQYKCHVQDIGWEDWKQNGAQSGTTGRNKKIEAIRIKLVNLSGYSVMYRAYVEGLGWQPWVSDGIEAGSTGKNLKLEAIQVKIVKTSQVTKTEPQVQYYSHIQDIGWETAYSKVNGATSGVEGKKLKVEAMCLQLTGVQENAQIQYQCHVQDIGWENWKQNGEKAGTTGQNKKIEAIRIKVNNLSGYSVMYRAYVEGLGWQEWVKDGALSGTTGKNLKLEAIQVKIVKK